MYMYIYIYTRTPIISIRNTILQNWILKGKNSISLILNSRSGSLMHVNTMIREQLEQATSANQLMAADVKRVTLEWQRSRDELEVKDQEWRQEEQVRI